MHTTYNQAFKEISAASKSVGLVFRAVAYKINGRSAWAFYDRETGFKVMDSCSFWSVLEDCNNGFIKSYNADTREFGK